MMVRVDDRQIGFEDLLAQFGEPFRVGQRAGIGKGFDGHGISPRGRRTDTMITVRARSQNPAPKWIDVTASRGGAYRKSGS
jgi:hypothetical protein